jgi:hypothetical protein
LNTGSAGVTLALVRKRISYWTGFPASKAAVAVFHGRALEGAARSEMAADLDPRRPPL